MPLLDQHGGTGVAQVVESKTIQSEGVDRRFEDSPVEVGVPQNRSIGRGEDHPLWVPGYATEFEVGGKALTEEAGDRNRPRRVVLGGCEHDAPVDLRDGLTGAKLKRANLAGAGLLEADLSGAVLSGAVLTGANLSEASLYRANLQALTGRGRSRKGSVVQRVAQSNSESR